MDARLVHPFTYVIARPTDCGKTTFVTRLLGHSSTLIRLPPENTKRCYGKWQPLYSTFSATQANINLVDGLSDLSSFDPRTRNFVVIDDLMSETDERVGS